LPNTPSVLLASIRPLLARRSTREEWGWPNQRAEWEWPNQRAEWGWRDSRCARRGTVASSPRAKQLFAYAEKYHSSDKKNNDAFLFFYF